MSDNHIILGYHSRRGRNWSDLELIPHTLNERLITKRRLSGQEKKLIRLTDLQLGRRRLEETQGDMSLQEAKENQKQIYGPNMDPDMYQGELGNCMYLICIIGLSLIPLEIFLEDLVVNRIEDPIIQEMQA